MTSLNCPTCGNLPDTPLHEYGCPVGRVAYGHSTPDQKDAAAPVIEVLSLPNHGHPFTVKRTTRTGTGQTKVSFEIQFDYGPQHVGVTFGAAEAAQLVDLLKES